MQMKMIPNQECDMFNIFRRSKSDSRRCWPDDCTAATERSRQEKQKSKPACPRNCRFLSAHSLVSRSHSCVPDFTSVFLTSGRPVRWLLLSGWFSFLGRGWAQRIENDCDSLRRLARHLSHKTCLYTTLYMDVLGPGKYQKERTQGEQ